MRKIALTLGVALGLVAAAPASAQGMMDTMMGGLYVGGSIGLSRFNDRCTGGTCDDKDVAWRILAGYQINGNFAAEIGYHNFGKVTSSDPGGTTEEKGSVLELVGIGAFPVWDKLSVYGKLGVYHGELKAGGVASGKDTNNNFTFGLGAQYDVTRQLGVRGELQRYNDLGGSTTGKSAVDVLSVGAIWRFQ